MSEIEYDRMNKSNGLDMLASVSDSTIAAGFFDPQYRGILDKLAYSNEADRQKGRCSLPQMSEPMINEFIMELYRVIRPSGHLFLWLDKYHLCSDYRQWLSHTEWEVVDMITWNKLRMGMGYRTRRTSEYCIILQKPPKRAKGVWTVHNIPDVWNEKAGKGIHAKPIKLQTSFITATTKEGETVIDPAAGSYSVWEACKLANRRFLGCDING